MPTFREITGLRKGGNLDAARGAALEALENAPHDRYIQGAYGWVLYEYLKRDAEAFHKDQIKIEKLLHTLNHVAKEYQRMDALLRPDLLHSFLLTQVVKISDEWPEFVRFFRWWGVDNFREDDRKPFHPADGGRPIPSLEMRALHAVGKTLTRGHLKGEDSEWALETLDEALSAHPDDLWLNYYKAKSLLAFNRSKEALHFILPVVMRNLRAGWLWGLLGQIIEPEDGAKAMICYYRAINVAGQPSEVLNTRLRLAHLLAKAERFAEAARQVYQVRIDREEAGYRLGQDLAELMDSAWFKSQAPSSYVKEPNVEREALEVLCHLFPEGFVQRFGVLESHNKEKGLGYLAFSPREGIALPYRFHKGLEKALPGTVFEISLFRVDGRPKVVYMRKAREDEGGDLVREIVGTLHIGDGKPYGFVHLANGDRAFVSPDLLTTSRIVSGSEVIGIAVLSVDKKTNKEGLKCLSFSIHK